MKSPCYLCEERYLTCHSNCCKYQSFRKEIDDYKTNEREINDYVMDAKERMRTTWKSNWRSK